MPIHPTLLSPKNVSVHTQKIQKLLANLGYASRREIEKWIKAGRISVDGTKASLGDRVSTKDSISIDDYLIPVAHSRTTHCSPKTLLYYKPVGEICSKKDLNGRPTVFTVLPSISPQRWVMIGRLDLNSEGLLLFTSDGLLSHRLLHPSYQIEREYAVRVHGKATPKMIQTLKTGVLLDTKITRFTSIIEKGHAGSSNAWYRVILKEGRQRIVRRLWATQGLIVSRLIRIRFGPISLCHTLKPGQWIWLNEEDVSALQRKVGL